MLLHYRAAWLQSLFCEKEMAAHELWIAEEKG
jgi:hypothetical protein